VVRIWGGLDKGVDGGGERDGRRGWELDEGGSDGILTDKAA